MTDTADLTHETAEFHECRTTTAKADDGIHEDQGATNLRLAFGIFGALVTCGAVNVDLRDPLWARKVDIAVMAIAAVLNQS